MRQRSQRRTGGGRHRRGGRERLAFVGRRKALILLCGVLASAGTTGLAYLRTPVYEATARLSLTRTPAEFQLEGTAGIAQSRQGEVATQVELINSDAVRAKVTEVLGEAPRIRATPVADSSVFEIRGRASTPDEAADAVNAYANAFVDVRRAVAIDQFLAASEKAQASVNALADQINAAPDPQKEALLRQQAQFKAKLNELRYQAEIQTGDVEVLSPAKLPTPRVGPLPLRDGGVALAIGLMVGVVVAGGAELFDDSVRTREDLVRVLPETPVLGMIPTVASWKVGDDAVVASLSEPQSAASEAYRSLRTAIQFMAGRHGLHTLLITSAGPAEGKSTTAANLAVTFAAAGQRVVLIGADLRRPRVHEFFGLTNEVGFTSVLLGKVPLSEALQEVPEQPGLFVLASGPLPPNPAELLSSNRTAEMLTSLQIDADLVIIDSPPALAVTDSAVLGARVDATLLVSVPGATTHKELRRAVETFDRVDGRMLGLVLNGVSDQEFYDDWYRSGADAAAGRRREPTRH